MNGPQDMGGFMRFGPVKPEANEPVFHEEWERRVLALTLATDACGQWNLDILRHARESFPALKYWSSRYYDIRIEAHIKLMIERGMITEAEISAGRMKIPPKPVKAVLKADMVQAVLAKGGPANRPATTAARFNTSNKVRAHDMSPAGHTRLPRYVQGRFGEIITVHGAHVFPDSSAHGLGEDPKWLYTVRFTAKELWGYDNKDSVMLDLWEPYLEPA